MENNNEKKIKLTFNKKVISISFLALALFMLLAVSYAYFTATVTGNDTAKKTTVTTATMNLVFHGENILETKDNMIPGESVDLEFSVKNEGTATAVYNIDIIDVENTFEDKSDLVYSIVRKEDEVIVEEIIAPSSAGTLASNLTIAPQKTDEFILTIKFKETNDNQNDNQDKKFVGKVQINSVEGDTLAAEILKNNEIQDSKTIDFSKGGPDCGSLGECNNPTSNGEGLFAAPDDEGISYYFRGAVTNNNVTFANKKWKILRINGDGSIRLVYNDTNRPIGGFNSYTGDFQYQVEDVGYTSDNSHHCTNAEPCYSDYQDGTFKKYYIDSNTNSGETTITGEDSDIKTTLETWYISNLKDDDAQIALETYCNDTSIIEKNENAIYFGSKDRIRNNLAPTLTCPNPTDYQSSQTHNYGGIYKLKIGLATVDELLMVGISPNADKRTQETTFFPYHGSAYSMSPANYDYSNQYANVYDMEGLFIASTGLTNGYDPILVINLNPDVTFTGDGSTTNPYIVQ